MKIHWSWLLLFYGCFLFIIIDAVTIPIVDEEVMKPQDGQICGFGDMNKDRYTDLIVQSQSSNTLTVLIQSENGKFSPSKFPPIKLKHGPGSAVCAVADFNGDALPDIMVTYDNVGDSFKSDIYLNDGTVFVPHQLNFNLAQPPTIVDINGDGIADIVGFLHENKSFFCLRGDRNISKMDNSCANVSFPGHESLKDPFQNFPHIFADLNGDLSSEIIFALEKPGNETIPRFEAWKLRDLGLGYWEQLRTIPDIPITTGVKFDNFGSVVVADFDADGSIDLLIPVCRTFTCQNVEYILIYSEKKGWVYFQIDLKDSQLVVETGGPVFRVGDFTLDGYPDLIATVSKGDSIMPVIFENVEYTGNQNFSRKFEMMVSQKIPQLVIPAEMAQGRIKMAAFFDLKEDGTLDILVEYTDAGNLKFNFIRCDDKGDTTFLKVQIFTNVCTRDCKNSNPNEIGSGISWHGACAYFSMPDSYGNTRMSAQCQLPQTAQRALHSPFLLFGLGRSPNFIDEVKLGSPRLPDQSQNQHSVLKQIVPNSRIIVVPPEGADTHWQSRLYLTPSQLIIQSVAVLFSVCVILIILIVFLHYRERQQDRKERQAQLHRFHFDAM